MLRLLDGSGDKRGLRVFFRPFWIAGTSADTPYPLGECLSKNAYVGFAQNLQMMKVNLVDLNRTFTSWTPTHERILNVIEGLFRPFEQNYRSSESPGNEACGPVGLHPVRAPTFFTKQILNPVCGRALEGSPSFGRVQLFHFVQALDKIVQLPQPASLTVLQNPRVENSEKSHFLTLCFKPQHNLLRDVSSIAQTAQAIRPMRLNRSHRCNI